VVEVADTSVDNSRPLGIVLTNGVDGQDLIYLPEPYEEKTDRPCLFHLIFLICDM